MRKNLSLPSLTRSRRKWKSLEMLRVRLTHVADQPVSRDAEDVGRTPSGAAAAPSDSATTPSLDQAKGVEFDRLSPTQAAAVRHAWQSPDRLIVIRGAAGTGKTTMTKALLAGIDVPWVILAPSAEASRGVLRREGFHGRDSGEVPGR